MSRSLLLTGVATGLLALSGCKGVFDGISQGASAYAPMEATARARKPIPVALKTLMASKGMAASEPIVIRIFKEENVLEVWKRKGNTYELLKTYEICKYSGELGPKIKEGDRQAPEGFYEVGSRLMNPNSRYYLSINMGYPNAYDRAHDRTGSYLMIHGACSSAGCYAMTDPAAQEIYALARDAFHGGQKNLQIQAFPFRMTPENMARHRDSEHFAFWRMLKQGYDHFELTRRPPVVGACGGQYVFNMKGLDGRLPGPMAKDAAKAACPPMGIERGIATAYAEKLDGDTRSFEAIVAAAEGRDERDLPKIDTATAFPNVTLLGASNVEAPGDS